MKKLITIVSLVVLFSSAACDKKDSSADQADKNVQEQVKESAKPADKGSANMDISEKTLAQANTENYSALIKREFGIDVSPEDGFQLDKLNPLEADDKSILVHGINTDSKGMKALAKKYFDQSAKVSSDGILTEKYNEETGESDYVKDSQNLEEFTEEWPDGDDFNGCEADWFYKYNGKLIHANFRYVGHLKVSVSLKVQE